ncbi:hypothetical protein BG006_011343 [Podila minutissima]|uniref:Uncharacterized protein n=1 Tax=Podila minutissima TaxID=64525 RepID=A0A9P5VHZ4_9FUNG|nr:hypothetical protein BG006_011343 [Podila minutissima]
MEVSHGQLMLIQAISSSPIRCTNSDTTDRSNCLRFDICGKPTRGSNDRSINDERCNCRRWFNDSSNSRKDRCSLIRVIKKRRYGPGRLQRLLHQLRIVLVVVSHTMRSTIQVGPVALEVQPKLIFSIARLAHSGGSSGSDPSISTTGIRIDCKCGVLARM